MPRKPRVQHLRTVWMTPDDELLRKAKAVAALKGVDLADIVHDAIQEHVNSFFAQGGNMCNRLDTPANK